MYALKKVIKILAIVAGLFFVGLAYLQDYQILSINWNKLQASSQDTVSMITNATTRNSGHINRQQSWAFLVSTIYPVNRKYGDGIRCWIHERLGLEMFKKLIEVGAKILGLLDDPYVPPVVTNSNHECLFDGTAIETFKPTDFNKDNIFHDIVGYSDIKREFVKVLDSSSPVSILLVGPPGCGKSEFLNQIRKYFGEESVLIDGSYGSKAGIFQVLYDKRPMYVLLDEVDKLSCQDLQALLNLMEHGRLTKTAKFKKYEIEHDLWVFATANNERQILGSLLNRFDSFYLAGYTEEEFMGIALQRLRKEGIKDEPLSLYKANSVLRGLGSRSLRDAIRIARKCKTMEQVDETVHTMKRYCK